MISPNDATEVVPYLTSAATIVYVQKWLKTRPAYQAFIKALPGADQWAHWIVAGVASFVASLGIHVVWNWDVIKGGQAVFTIPGFWELMHGASDWFKIYVLQATLYDLKHRSWVEGTSPSQTQQPVIIIPGSTPAP